MWSFADLPSASGAVDNESILEFYYKVALTGAVSITPSLQWISNPSGDPSLDDAFLASLAVKVSF